MEFADELVDGVKGASLPLIQRSLGLSYAQLGLLASLPLIVGGALELPLGSLAGYGRRRRLTALGGGLVFIGSLAAMAFARNFGELAASFVVFFPASGAFVSLTQAGLMDADPDRQAQLMARWDMAGWAGSLCGPLLLAAALAAGGSWRASYLALAALSGLAWSGVLLSGHADAAPAGAEEPDAQGRAGVREIAAAARTAARWLIMLEVADLLVDGLTGFLAIYLVNVVHLRPAVAALAIAVRLGAGLAGDAALVVVLERVPDLTVLRGTALIAALLYPAFLLTPGLAAKLAILAVLSAATATWYPVLQARLYGSLPGRSAIAVTLNTGASLAAGVCPLAVGLAAEAFGLTGALGMLAIVPVAVLAGARPGN